MRPAAKKSRLPEPGAATVRMMAHEAAARDEAVDEVLEAEVGGLWKEWRSTADESASAGAGAGGPAGGKGGGSLAGSNPYGMRELTVLEKKYMADAASRQKANQIVKQVVGGKEWVGPPFLCKPAELMFADFDVGATYELKFTLTNVSYTFNAFRPQDLPIAVRSFFTLTHTPPGRMSAGVTAPLTLTFTPKVNEDIDSEITLLTSTGPMTIPLKARTKKCKIAIPDKDPPTDFGAVVMGEERTLPLAIHNGGALACPLKITVLHATQPEADDDDPDTTDDDDPPVFTHSAPSEVPGYSTVVVQIRYAPMRAGDAACLYQISFDNFAPSEEVSVHGVGVQVPIYLERETLDLQCCAFDGLYREDILIHNRSRVQKKIQMKVPRPLQGALEFVPAMGYVQARSSLTVSLKLRTSAELLQRCAEYQTSDDTILVPIRVLVPDQVLPVSFTLRAQLTTPQLLLERNGRAVTSLDFGTCPVNATRSLKLTLRNPSALPQRFGFPPLPKGVDVQPGDALGTLLPGEAVEVDVRWSPLAATHFHATLTCRTSLNRAYPIKLIGQGVTPHLTLSHTALALPPTAEGDTSSADVTLTNETSHAQAFELRPDGACSSSGRRSATCSPARRRASSSSSPRPSTPICGTRPAASTARSTRWPWRRRRRRRGGGGGGRRRRRGGHRRGGRGGRC